MDAGHFDRITRFFAHRRVSRRQTLTSVVPAVAGGLLGVTGVHTSAAQEDSATPSAGASEKTMYLFVQSFQSGAIAPKEGEADTYTLTLEHGTGQTIYFADRPSRDVGIVPTGQFLQGLGFTPDNPPNAALITETAPGETDIAVVELFNPVVADDGALVTYDVQVLANWQETLEMGLSDAPANLAEIEPTFGAAHLFIDDCPTDGVVTCSISFMNGSSRVVMEIGVFQDVDTCWNYGVCMPCEPYGHGQPSRCATQEYWTNKCRSEFSGCDNGPESCTASFDWLFADCL